MIPRGTRPAFRQTPALDRATRSQLTGRLRRSRASGQARGRERACGRGCGPFPRKESVAHPRPTPGLQIGAATVPARLDDYIERYG